MLKGKVECKRINSQFCMIMVTVYCIAYNHEKYIRDALEGFIKQKTSFEFEVIVHDDASTDGTKAIIQEYADRYPTIIKPIYQAQNTYNTHNRVYDFLLPRTNGKYIAICEGDDYWIDANKLQSQYDFLESHYDCSAVVHLALQLNPNGVIQSYYDFNQNDRVFLDISDILENHAVFPTASLFFRKEFYYRHKEVLKRMRAFDYVIKTLLAMDGRICVLPYTMSVYRFQAIGAWTTKVWANKEKRKQHLMESIDNLQVLNRYSGYKYDCLFDEAIKKRQFELFRLELDIKSMKSESYKLLYERMSRKEKVSILLRRLLVSLESACNRFVKV